MSILHYLFIIGAIWFVLTSLLKYLKAPGSKKKKKEEEWACTKTFLQAYLETVFLCFTKQPFFIFL